MYYGFVYEWTNNINGKKYIGSHAGTIDDGYIGSGKVFKRAIAKYGIENFTREILEFVEVKDRKFLLEREKYYMDEVSAYYSKMYYNVAKDVIGGDLKAGWSDERRQEFSNQIKQVWANRSEEEKARILHNVRHKNKTYYDGPEGEIRRASMRERFYKNLDKIVAGIKARDPDERRRIAQDKADSVPPEIRRARAQKGVSNRNPQTEALARVKRKNTIANRSEEEKKIARENASRGRKGKMMGGDNPKSKRIIVDGKVYDTLKDAMCELSISEFILNRRLKSDEFPNYQYISKE